MGPVSEKFTDPVKPTIATKAGASMTITRKTDVDLFGEDNLSKDSAMEGDIDPGNIDGDEEMLDLDKDWIIDDMDGAINDEPAADIPRSNGYVKEMGKLMSSSHSSSRPDMHISEYHQGTTTFPARIHAIPE